MLNGFAYFLFHIPIVGFWILRYAERNLPRVALDVRAVGAYHHSINGLGYSEIWIAARKPGTRTGYGVRGVAVFGRRPEVGVVTAVWLRDDVYAVTSDQ